MSIRQISESGGAYPKRLSEIEVWVQVIGLGR